MSLSDVEVEITWVNNVSQLDVDVLQVVGHGFLYCVQAAERGE